MAPTLMTGGWFRMQCQVGKLAVVVASATFPIRLSRGRWLQEVERLKHAVVDDLFHQGAVMHWPIMER